MMLYLLFAVAAFAECDTGTCFVCKNTTGCDWYGFDCLNKTSSAVTTLSIPATATCGTCQAANCDDCQNQTNCSWFSSDVPGLPGKCAASNSIQSVYTLVATCPVCQTYTNCSSCNTAGATAGCGWYELPGRLNGKCRETSPSFAYSKVTDCAGNPCSGVATCQKCQDVNKTDGTGCNWFTSKSPSFYNSKCDDDTPGLVDGGLYNVVTGVCPECAGTSCLNCKEESNCKWVATSTGLGTAFGQCLKSADSTPTGKSIIATCPATCQLHSCVACKANSQCSWFTGGGAFADDSCDLASDATLQHPVQHAATTCDACMADRCYECNNLAGCGWYARKVGFVTVQEGCFATPGPSGRSLVSNTDSKCDGVPSGSSQVAVSMGVLAVLAFLA